MFVGSPGVAFTGSTPYATSFPQVCLTAYVSLNLFTLKFHFFNNYSNFSSSFDVDLWATVGNVMFCFNNHK